MLTKDSVLWIHRHLILGRITDETLSIRERNIRRGSSVSLIIRNDLHTIMLPYSHTTVRGTEIDTDSRSFSRHVCYNLTIQHLNYKISPNPILPSTALKPQEPKFSKSKLKSPSSLFSNSRQKQTQN